MMQARTSIEIIAPSIDEAIAKGLSDLGLSRDQVELEILDSGTKGLFGIGQRQARVRLTVLAASGASRQAVPSEMKEVLAEEDLSAETIDVLATRVEPESPVTKAPPQSTVMDVPSEISVHVARETVSELLEKMNIDASVSVVMKDPEDERSRPTLWVDINGQDLSILIGPRAETLNALQYIASLIISKELGHNTQIVIDVEGYRIRRVQQLQQLARRMADQAVKTGHRQALEPMPAGDRRIIHIELRNNSQVSTESVGEEPYRKVTIVPN
jgi:spoIIIJ-associated protein